MADTETDVLVVGAGLAGLSAALFLARRGVGVRVVERHSATSLHPKAAGQNPRTMELLGFGGVAGRVLEANDIRGEGGDFTIKIADSVGGQVFATFAENVAEMVAQTAPCTPMPWAFVSQDGMEPILLEAATELGAQASYSTELVDFAQDDDGIEARLRDVGSGAETTVRARYLVAADGPRSQVRERLGIGQYGMGTLTRFVGMIFEADLSASLPAGSTGWYYLQNPEFTGTFGPTDKPDRHTFFVEYSPDKGESPDDFTDRRCVELIRKAVNLPDLEPRLLNVAEWEMAARVADRWRDGRVFLAGDAAKVTPPTGGMGGNTAIGDGYDIAWKLAAVLHGEAGEGLLDSYEAERRPIADLVVAESLGIYASRMAPHLADQVPEQIGAAKVLLGFRYRSDAVDASDTDADPAPVEDPLEASGRPGFRAPHVWLDRSGSRVSTVDLFGSGWVLIAARDGSGWPEAARKVASELNVPLEAHAVGDGLADPEGTLPERYGIGPSGASLVRPDGIVAWRTGAETDDPTTTLRSALTALLSR
ncbi:aklavinone 12-hydroxylase RdmE [Spirillospora sp. NPDC047279]|uniref:aklavinone 12-hydroxylase RdmE n=1 Tax=Spirillospora sp. NPDC047279 TaxID=3155478 RepID=UPI00340ED812